MTSNIRVNVKFKTKKLSAIWQCASLPPPGRTIKILSAIFVLLEWGRLILMSPLARWYPRIHTQRVTLRKLESRRSK